MIYIGLDKEALLDQNADLGSFDEYGINIVINSEECLSSELFTFLLEKDYKFIFTINDYFFDASSQPDNALDILFMFTSLQNYCRTAGKKVVIFDLAGAPSELLNNVEKLKRFFLQNGDLDIFLPQIVDFNMAPLEPAPECLLELNIDETHNSLNDKISFSKLASSFYPFILVKPSFPFSDLPTHINELFRKDILVLFDNKKVIDFLETENQNLLQRKRLYFEFIHLSKQLQEQQYTDLLEWYSSEYEILPLWFKRIGHVVKVFTGKRSLKSLFK